MVLDWAELDPAKLERVVKMLVRAACGATGIDGSGGDGSQDLRHDGPDGLTIYEVKSFTRRLTTSQRRQVARSLTGAVGKHAPARWVLVIPLDPTPAELTWFDKLRVQHPQVVLEWFGRDWLDGQIAGREDLISYVEGAQYKVLRRAAQHAQERAALATGEDYLQRVQELHALGGTISPFWRWDVQDSPIGPANVLTAQTPDAATADPVSINTQFTFPAGDPDADAARAVLQRWLRSGGDVEIDGRFIDDVQVLASSEATQRLIGDPSRPVSSVRLITVPDTTDLPLHCTLALEDAAPPSAGEGVVVLAADGLDEPERGLPSVPFAFTKRIVAPHGVAMTGADPSGLLLGRVQAGADESEGTELNLSLAPLAGRYPHDALPAIAFLAACRPGTRLVFKQGPVVLTSYDAGGEASANVDYLHNLIAALELLQNHLGQLVPIPTDPPAGREAGELMAVASALTGTPGLLPYDGLSAPIVAGQIGQLLDSVPTAPGALYGAPDAFPLTLDGTTYKVPGLAMWSPGMQLTNREQLHALAADERAGRPVAPAAAQFTCVGEHKAYLIRAVDDLGEPYLPVPGLPGRR
ncbi:hypothetical protein SAMN05660199_01763 [Klenkia soli]|uniref:Uncharacterized protein n=1 Tax=Klenkia soli TaxID=1052260 RepID=A0A1H0IST7_9ACTN|nr:hypothetical protein SAMN05660199_01763 [Klenkia soli]